MSKPTTAAGSNDSVGSNSRRGRERRWVRARATSAHPLPARTDGFLATDALLLDIQKNPRGETHRDVFGAATIRCSNFRGDWTQRSRRIAD
jgi:hypothetical protein